VDESRHAIAKEHKTSMLYTNWLTHTDIPVLLNTGVVLELISVHS